MLEFFLTLVLQCSLNLRYEGCFIDVSLRATDLLIQLVLYMSVYVCRHNHMFMYVHIHVDMYMRRPAVSNKAFVNCSLPYSLRQGLSLNRNSQIRLCWLASELQGSSSFLPTSVGITDMPHQACYLCWC